MAVQFTVDVSDLQKKAEKLSKFPIKSKNAMAEALNRGIKRVQTNIVKEVAKEYDVTQGQVKKTIKTRRATAGNLQAEADVTDKRLKLGSFKFRAARNKYRSPISVRVKKSNGFKKSTSQPPMFAGQSKVSGRKEIFRRDTKGQYEVEYPFTLAIPQMVKNKDVYKRISEDAADYIQDRFQHNLEYQLKKTLGTK